MFTARFCHRVYYACFLLPFPTKKTKTRFSRNENGGKRKRKKPSRAWISKEKKFYRLFSKISVGGQGQNCTEKTTFLNYFLNITTASYYKKVKRHICSPQMSNRWVTFFFTRMLQKSMKDNFASGIIDVQEEEGNLMRFGCYSGTFYCSVPNSKCILRTNPSFSERGSQRFFAKNSSFLGWSPIARFSY